MAKNHKETLELKRQQQFVSQIEYAQVN